jgi:hypothetical protein
VAWVPSQLAPHSVPLAGHTPCAASPVTNEQLPTLPGTAQDSQAVWHAWLQHTPSAHCPEAHSAPLWHTSLFFFLHTPLASQVFAPVHESASSSSVTG